LALFFYSFALSLSFKLYLNRVRYGAWLLAVFSLIELATGELSVKGVDF